MSDKLVRVEVVSHYYDALPVLRGINLTVHSGEFLAVVGPSGCGKSTLLNLIAGSLRPQEGRIHRHGKIRRVYQQDGLFPWLTVRQNIAMGLDSHLPPAERDRQLQTLVNLIRLNGFENHYPHQLSVGMRQRVELARALAGSADLLLLDEPFSALDYQERMRLRRELVRLLTERPRTVVMVTHDVEEAAQLADRVIVLTQRPARISLELSVEAPRPRSLTHPAVLKAIERIIRELGLEEDERSAAEAAPGGHLVVECLRSG